VPCHALESRAAGDLLADGESNLGADFPTRDRRGSARWMGAAAPKEQTLKLRSTVPQRERSAYTRNSRTWRTGSNVTIKDLDPNFRGVVMALMVVVFFSALGICVEAFVR
jgi:hypothetical protein